MTTQAGMRPLTRLEHKVLSAVYPSDKPAARHTQALKWDIQNRCDVSPQTLDIMFHNFTTAGLIDETGGFTKRTKAGDSALVEDAPTPNTQTAGMPG